MTETTVPRPFICDTFDPAWIRREREEQALSLAEVSRRSGLSVAEVRTCERSRAARTSRVALVLAALGVRDPNELRARHGPTPDEVGIDGEALRTLREARGLSQRQASRRSGVGTQAIRMIETGETRDPSLRVVLRLLRAYGASGQVARYVVVRPHAAQGPAETRPTSETAPEPSAAPDPAGDAVAAPDGAAAAVPPAGQP